MQLAEIVIFSVPTVSFVMLMLSTFHQDRISMAMQWKMFLIYSWVVVNSAGSTLGHATNSKIYLR